MFTDIDDAFSWIESFTNLEKDTRDLKRRYRPDRMRVLLEQFGNPQNTFKVIHTAGSKGKGSVCALLEAALRWGGFKTGIYSSPHIIHYRERIRVDGVPLPDNESIRMIAFIRDHMKELPGGTDPTTFELLTLLGFLLFKEAGCEWVVVETGLGGRLDATNTVMPEAVVLTPVEKEHTQWLGDSLEQIAAEKAGIIKPYKPVFSAPQTDEVKAVFTKTAKDKGAEILFLEEVLDRIDFSDRPGISRYTLIYRNGEELSGELTLPGKIQPWNAALALEVLKSLFPETETQTWLRGFRDAALPARMQILSTSPLRVLDGSHTPRSVALALESFKNWASPEKENVLLFACQDDKDADAMARLLAPEFSRIFITTPGIFKKSHPRQVLDTFKTYKEDCQLEEVPARALDQAAEGGGNLLIMGSFFLAGEILKIYGDKQ